MQFRITIDCDNEAFEDDPAHAIRGIIRRHFQGDFYDLVHAAFDEDFPTLAVITLRDSNGNTVGKAEFIDA